MPVPLSTDQQNALCDTCEIGALVPLEAFPLPKGQKPESPWRQVIQHGARVFVREEGGWRRTE